MCARNLTMFGFSSKRNQNNELKPCNQLGVGSISYGLRADGSLYSPNHDGVKFRPLVFCRDLAEGDIVGCGLIPAQNEIFYTLNGAYLGVAFRDVELGIIESSPKNTD